MSNNPLLEHHTLPPFEAIRPEHVVPAIEKIIADNRQATEALAQQQDVSWQTLAAPLEALDDRLSQAWSPVSHLNSTMNSSVACSGKWGGSKGEQGRQAGQSRALSKGSRSPRWNTPICLPRRIITGAPTIQLWRWWWRPEGVSRDCHPHQDNQLGLGGSEEICLTDFGLVLDRRVALSRKERDFFCSAQVL